MPAPRALPRPNSRRSWAVTPPPQISEIEEVSDRPDQRCSHPHQPTCPLTLGGAPDPATIRSTLTYTATPVRPAPTSPSCLTFASAPTFSTQAAPAARGPAK